MKVGRGSCFKSAVIASGKKDLLSPWINLDSATEIRNVESISL